MQTSRHASSCEGELSSPVAQTKPAKGVRSGTSDTTTATTQTQSGPYGLSSPTTAEERGVEDERRRIANGKDKEGSCQDEFGGNHIATAQQARNSGDAFDHAPSVDGRAFPLVGAGTSFALTPSDAVALPALLSAFYPATAYTAPIMLRAPVISDLYGPPTRGAAPSTAPLIAANTMMAHRHNTCGPTTSTNPVSASLLHAVAPQEVTNSEKIQEAPVSQQNSTIKKTMGPCAGGPVAMRPRGLTLVPSSTSPTLASLAFTMAAAALRAAELEENETRRVIRDDEKKEREKAVRMAQNLGNAFSHHGKRYNKHFDSDSDLNSKIKAKAAGGSSDASTNARGRTSADWSATDKIAPTRISDSKRIELFGEQHIRDAFELAAARPITLSSGGGSGERSGKPPLGSELREFVAGEHSHDRQGIINEEATAQSSVRATAEGRERRRNERLGKLNVCLTTSKRDGLKMKSSDDGRDSRDARNIIRTISSKDDEHKKKCDHRRTRSKSTNNNNTNANYTINDATTCSAKVSLSKEKKVSSVLTKSNIDAIQTAISAAVTPYRKRDAVAAHAAGLPHAEPSEFLGEAAGAVSAPLDPPTTITTVSSSSTTCPRPSNAPRSCFSPLDTMSTDTPTTELTDHATTCTASTGGTRGADMIAAVGHHTHTQRGGGGRRINDYMLPPPTTAPDNVDVAKGNTTAAAAATTREKPILSSTLSSSSSSLNEDEDESKHARASNAKANDQRTTHSSPRSPLTAHALSNRSAVCADSHPHVTILNAVSVSSTVSTAAALSHAPTTASTTDTGASQTTNTATTTTICTNTNTTWTATTSADTTADLKTASITNAATKTNTIGTTSVTATAEANAMTTGATTTATNTTTSATAADTTNPTSTTTNTNTATVTLTASGLGTSRSNTNSSSRSQAYSLFPRLLESFLFRGFYCKHLTLKGDCRDDRIHTYVQAAPTITTTNATTGGTRSSKALGSGATTPHRSISDEYCGGAAQQRGGSSGLEKSSAAYTAVEKSHGGVTNNTASFTNALLMGTATSATGFVSAEGGGGAGSVTASSLDGTPYSQALGHSANDEVSFNSSRCGGNTPVLVLDAADRAYLKHVAESLGYEGVGGVSVHTPPSSLRRGSPAAGMVPLHPTVLNSSSVAFSAARRSVTPRSRANNSESSNTAAATTVARTPQPLVKPSPATCQKKAAFAAGARTASRSSSRASSPVAALETLTPRGADTSDGLNAMANSSIPPASGTSAASSSAFGPSPTAIAHNPSIIPNMCLSRAVLQLAQNQRAALCTLRALRDPSNAAFQAAANDLPCQSFSVLHNPFDLEPQQLKAMIPAPYLCFYASEVPQMPIGEYIAFLYRHRPIGPEVFMLAMGVLWRVSRRLPVCSRSLHRMLLTAVVLSQKSRGESPYILSYYAGMGGVQADDLGVMERAMLSVLKYDLFGSQGTRLYVDIVYSLRVHCQITATLLREDWVSGAWSEATASLPIPCLDAFEREQRAEMAVLMAADKARMARRKPFSSSSSGQQ